MIQMSITSITIVIDANNVYRPITHYVNDFFMLNPSHLNHSKNLTIFYPIYNILDITEMRHIIYLIFHNNMLYKFLHNSKLTKHDISTRKPPFESTTCPTSSKVIDQTQPPSPKCYSLSILPHQPNRLPNHEFQPSSHSAQTD